MAFSVGASRSGHRSRGSSGSTDLAAPVRDAKADLEAAVMRLVLQRVRRILAPSFSGDAQHPLGHTELVQIIHQVVMQQCRRIRQQNQPEMRGGGRSGGRRRRRRGAQRCEEVADLEAPSTEKKNMRSKSLSS